MSIKGDNRGQMTINDSHVAMLGDHMQAEGLVEQKAARQKGK